MGLNHGYSSYGQLNVCSKVNFIFKIQIKFSREIRSKFQLTPQLFQISGVFNRFLILVFCHGQIRVLWERNNFHLHLYFSYMYSTPIIAINNTFEVLCVFCISFIDFKTILYCNLISHTSGYIVYTSH